MYAAQKSRVMKGGLRENASSLMMSKHVPGTMRND